MKNLSRKLPVLLACLLAITVSAFAQANHVVISQVYGGGGNGGGQYKNDFVELFNPTSAAVDLSGYKIGYFAASGSNLTQATLSGSIQPGHYFLLQAAAGADTTQPALPTPDFTTFTAAMSGTAGIVVLVPSSQTLASSVCPANITDLVAYGSGSSSCHEGSTTAGTTNGTSAYRTNPCIDTDNNSADFTVGTPVAHNSASTAVSCVSTPGPTSPSGSGTASPANAISGSTSVTLSVTVTGGTNPVSTGIAVAGDLSSIGGSATQAFTLASGTTYSFTITPTTSGNGNVTLPIAITDGQSRTGTTSITINVGQPGAAVAIHDIQGSKSLTATTVSPYVGQRVSTTGVVTGIGSAGYFLQMRDADVDANLTTPEGVYVFTSTAPTTDPSIVIGNYLRVTGTVATYPAVTASHTPATEITNSIPEIISTGQPLPTPVALTAANLTPSGGLYQMTRYEGMRVSFAGLAVVSGTDGNLTSEANAAVASNGQFYAVMPGTPTPVREPGIDIRDAAVPNTPINVAKFDDNPERLLIDTTFLGGAALDVASGSGVLNLTGIVDMTYSADSFYDPARIVVDRTYVPATYSTASTTQFATGYGTGRFSVAAYNVERMFDTDSTNNKYYDPVSQTVKNSSAVNLSPTAFDNRITKIARGILVNLNAPDVVALEEIENKGVAQAIATKISSLASSLSLPDPGYVGYGVSVADSTYTSDVGGISTGFLIKPSTVNVVSTTQMGQNETFNSPVDNSLTTLNDRPAFVMKAGIIRGTGVKDFPVTVIVNHLRSLSGISDASNYTRYKKELQARSLANIIQAAQTNGERVVSVGDYNAFEFSDGYTDTLGTVTGRILPADQVVQPGTLITVPAATDLVTTTTGTHSYSYLGNQQSLDHIVVTSNLMSAFSSYMAVNINADYPQTMYSDPSNAFRASDHDPVISYYSTPAPVASGTISPASLAFSNTNVGVTSTGQQVVITNTGERPLSIVNVGVTGDFAATAATACTTGIPVGGTCSVNVTFKPTVVGARAGTLTLSTNGGPTFTTSLTGLATVPDFSFGGSTGTNVSLTVQAGSTATLPLTFTSINGFTGTVTIGCNYTLPAPGVVCNVPPAFTLSGTSTQNVTFTTTTRNVTSGLSLSNRSGWTLAITLTFGGLTFFFAGRTRRFARHAGLLLVLLGVCFAATGCGSGAPSTNPYGTPAGAYTYTVTSTSGTLSKTVTVTLTVQ